VSASPVLLGVPVSKMIWSVRCVRAEAVRWIDEEWPGWVEVQFTESDGTVVSIVEKVPVVDYDDRVVPGVRFPVDLEIQCDVLDWVAHPGGNRSAAIQLRFNVEDRHGRTVFNVDERLLSTRS
jgi:hypothetical protein